MSHPDYALWYALVENGETGIYSSLYRTGVNRSDLLQELSSLSVFRSSAYQQKRDLFYQALQKQLNEEDSSALDTTAVLALAETPAWMGTSAVYLARALLNLEVDDELLGLRVSWPAIPEQSDIVKVSNFTDYIVFETEGPCMIQLYEANGQLLYTQTFTGSMLIHKSNYPPLVWYQLIQNGKTQQGKWARF